MTTSSRQRRLLLSVLLVVNVAGSSANIYTAQQPQQYAQQTQYAPGYAEPTQFHSYNSQPGIQYGSGSADGSFFPNQAALTAAATSFAASAAQQYAQQYSQTPQPAAQIDQANLAKYSQYLDILQKAYGIQLPGELTMQPNSVAAVQGQTAGGYATSQQQQVVNPSAQTYGQPAPQQPQSFSGYPQTGVQQPQVTSPTQAEITYQQQLAAYQQQQQQIAQQQQQQQQLAQQQQQQQQLAQQQQQQQQLAQQQQQQAQLAAQQQQQQQLAQQQAAAAEQQRLAQLAQQQQQQQQQQQTQFNQYGMQPNPYAQGPATQPPMNFLPAPQTPAAPYVPPTVPPTQAPTYNSNYQTAALGQYAGQLKPQVYTYPGHLQPPQKPTHSTSFGNENSVIEEENNHHGSVISAPQVVPPRPVQQVIATVTRAPPVVMPSSPVVPKSQPRPPPTTRPPTPPTTRRPPPPSTKAATTRPPTSATASPSQSLTQQIRKLPAVLYIDSRNEGTKKTETLLRDTYGLPLVTFYVDKVDKPAAIERQLEQLTAHKGLPYLFICGTFIGSDAHIENYHSNGQIPQLVEYVCGDDRKKKKKTKKTNSA